MLTLSQHLQRLRPERPQQPVPSILVSTESLFFFAQPDAQHPARNDHLSRRALADAGMAWFERPQWPRAGPVRFAHWACARWVSSSLIPDRSDSYPEGVFVGQSVLLPKRLVYQQKRAYLPAPAKSRILKSKKNSDETNNGGFDVPSHGQSKTGKVGAGDRKEKTKAKAKATPRARKKQ